MKKKIKDVKIGPFKYKVYFKSKLIEKSKEKGSKYKINYLGHADHDLGHIDIRNNLEKDREKDTLIHECLHIVWYASGASMVKDTDEECMVSLLAPWLLMLIQDNPELVEYLQQQ